jgi:hypothetical protein
MYIKFWLKNLKERDQVEDLNIDGGIRVTLTEIGREGVNWIHVSLDSTKGGKFLEEFRDY